VTGTVRFATVFIRFGQRPYARLTPPGGPVRRCTRLTGANSPMQMWALRPGMPALGAGTH